ncbi:WXG100 family type VII secretion target [Nocardia sp. NPDC051570]|uniref:WXG100 family type VII secretion target n=1 Tax=Nocardia sp. NPDC051570 TaxID=3364324 RepID=UPI0037AB0074
MSNNSNNTDQTSGSDDKKRRGGIGADMTAMDAAGVAMMSGATAVGAELEAVHAMITDLLTDWTGPQAEALAADWETTSTAGTGWTTHMHTLGGILRQGAAEMRQVEDQATAAFQSSAADMRKLRADFAATREARKARNQDPEATR